MPVGNPERRVLRRRTERMRVRVPRCAPFQWRTEEPSRPDAARRRRSAASFRYAAWPIVQVLVTAKQDKREHCGRRLREPRASTPGKRDRRFSLEHGRHGRIEARVTREPTCRGWRACRCRRPTTINGYLPVQGQPAVLISFPSGRDRSREDSAVRVASQPPGRERSAAACTKRTCGRRGDRTSPKRERRIQSATDRVSPCYLPVQGQPAVFHPAWWSPRTGRACGRADDQRRLPGPQRGSAQGGILLGLLHAR